MVYTDVLQTIILFCGFGFLIIPPCMTSADWRACARRCRAGLFFISGRGVLGGWNVVSLILVLVLNPIADPGRRLTMYSAHTEGGAKWSMVASGLMVMVFSVAIGITGMYAFQLNPHLPVADQALPWLVMNVLPPWLAAFVVVAMVSGMSSAANGNAAAAGTFFVRHIYPLVTGQLSRAPGGGCALGFGVSRFCFHRAGALHGKHCRIS